MRLIFLAIAFVTNSACAVDWVITDGGLSPDKKLAVAVFSPKGEFIDQEADAVLLIDQVSGKKIGPLEEISSSGGTWGTTTTNVHCKWSPDSSLLLVNSRTGRLMYDFQLYRIRGHRAVPLKLPDVSTHPKAKILEVLGFKANTGAEVSLAKDGSIVERRYGYTGKEGHWDDDHSKFGVKDFDLDYGVLLFIYRFDSSGTMKIIDIRGEPEPK